MRLFYHPCLNKLIDNYSSDAAQRYKSDGRGMGIFLHDKSAESLGNKSMSTSLGPGQFKLVLVEYMNSMHSPVLTV